MAGNMDGREQNRAGQEIEGVTTSDCVAATCAGRVELGNGLAKGDTIMFGERGVQEVNHDVERPSVHAG